MKIIPGFEFLKTKHCITGSILHVFRFHHCNVSEEMLLGLGSGVGFIYWQQKGTLPFLGGRANVGRSGESGLEVDAAAALGVKAIRHTTSSSHKAEHELLRRLEQNEPLAIQVDMGLLPYFPFFNQYHFGYHMVAAAGYDPATNEVTLADRDGVPHPVQFEQLSAARNSNYKPFPPANAWMEYNFDIYHAPRKETVKDAIRKCAQGMIQPPIKNLGIKGIQTAKQAMLAWPEKMEERDLVSACANVALYIRADAGTGGGLFRWMYADFLKEAAVILQNHALESAAADMTAAGTLWEQIADIAGQVKGKDSLVAYANDLSTCLDNLYEKEKITWSKLMECTN